MFIEFGSHYFWTVTKVYLPSPSWIRKENIKMCFFNQLRNDPNCCNFSAVKLADTCNILVTALICASGS